MNEKRVEWIDFVKAFAIYFMVLAHTGVTKNVNVLIHAFHMPVFFILSGYCYNETKYKEFGKLLKNRLRSLILPYLFWGTFLFAFWNVCLIILNKKNEMQGIGTFLYSIFIVNTENISFGVIQWFLTAMFFCELIFWCLGRLCKYNIYKVMIGIFIMAILAYCIPIIVTVRLPLAIDSALAAVVFYGLGWCAKKMQIFDKLSENPNGIQLSGYTILLVIGGILSLNNGEINLRRLLYGNIVLFYGNAIVISFAIIGIAIYITHHKRFDGLNKYMCIVGQNTLAVLVMNSTMIRMWKVVLGNKLEASSGQNVTMMINIAVSCGIVVVTTIIGREIVNCCPLILGKKQNKSLG
ncbi:MAG: acyltransferase family protein [Lachnospiraceae bacterium]|nr:acyltransferase family protein [Lachnospiraceae bacterium]